MPPRDPPPQVPRSDDDAARREVAHGEDAQDEEAQREEAQGVEVRRVAPRETWPLRRQVLRPHLPPDEPLHGVDGDDHPDVVALAAIAPDGSVVAAAIAYPEPCPWRPGEPAPWRLRGMAGAPGWRRRGVGARVLAALEATVVSAGATLLWCHARTPARGLYARAGFAEHGAEWTEPDIGPHVAMDKRLRP